MVALGAKVVGFRLPQRNAKLSVSAHFPSFTPIDSRWSTDDVDSALQTASNRGDLPYVRQMRFERSFQDDPQQSRRISGGNSARQRDVLGSGIEGCNQPGSPSCVRKRELLRVARGIYMVPVLSRFGGSAPSAHLFIEEFSKQRGEVIVPSGATFANALGFTTQVPVRMVFWTSGRSRKLNLGKLLLHLPHVPTWQLALAQEPAGEIVRALALAGPAKVRAVLKQIEEKVPRSELLKVALKMQRFPGWLASAVVRSVESGNSRRT